MAMDGMHFQSSPPHLSVSLDLFNKIDVGGLDVSKYVIFLVPFYAGCTHITIVLWSVYVCFIVTSLFLFIFIGIIPNLDGLRFGVAGVADRKSCR